jgi:UDP-N-acetylmuramate--alanine ligase
MSAIASVLLAMGHEVTGSDLKESAGVERLRAQGAVVHVGHAASQVGDVDAVTVSTAVRADNVEVRAARERDIPVLSRAELLAALAATRRTVAVSGTHGKTTTSSMLALVLLEAGLHPSFIIGGDVNEIGSGAVWDDGDLFVVEADESDGTFLELGADAVVVTNVEADHLDHYGTLDAIEAAFAKFLTDASGPKVVCADDPIASRLGQAVGAISYGLDPEAAYRIVDAETSQSGATFGLLHEGVEVARVELPVPGVHNIRNAAAALVMGVALGAPVEAAVAALGRFGGVARRFEHRGTTAGVMFVDDYAHNPGKVRAVMEAVAAGGWPRVVTVFQPHRYSRTERQWREFGDAFPSADVLVVTDVYGAGETPRPGVSGMLIVDAVLDERPWRRVAYLPHRADVVAYLRRELRAGDLCLTLGAGDITTLADDVQAALARGDGG